MSGAGFEARADSIDAHGKELLNSLGPSLREVMNASQVSLGTDVMGLIGQMYTGIFNEELEVAKNLLAKLPEAADVAGEGLISTANEYRQAEAGNQAAFGGMNT